MADVLSQGQIDLLLSSLQGGNSNKEEPATKQERKYRKYDFHSPKKFTKDKLRILNDVVDKYTRITSTKMGSLMRLGCETEIIAIEEQRYYEFSNALTDDDVLTVINVEIPEQIKNKPVLMHISPVLMVNFIDRMLGGEGETADVDSSYVYTDIETACYESIIKYFVDGLTDSWASYIKLSFNFGQLAINPGMFQAIGMDETVVIATINMRMDNVQGVLSVCFPGNLLSDIFLVLDRRINREKEEGLNYIDSTDDIMYYIRGSQLDVKAKMGEITLNLSDVYNLQVGDVINMNKPKNSEVELLVEGIPWFYGKLGQYKKNISVLVTDRYKNNHDSDVNSNVNSEGLPES